MLDETRPYIKKTLQIATTEPYPMFLPSAENILLDCFLMSYNLFHQCVSFLVSTKIDRIMFICDYSFLTMVVKHGMRQEQILESILHTTTTAS